VQVTVSSQPGSPQAPNEDAYFISADTNTVAIFDGATTRTDTGCIHGVAWFVHSLADSLGGRASLTPAKALTAAISHTARQHQHTCDLTHPGTPSAAVAILQARRKTLRYLMLGDVTIVLDLGHGIRVLTDNRVNATARAERRAADDLPSGSPEKTRALVRMKQAELAARNVTGGYWLAAADPSVITYALTGDVPRQNLHQAALLSDGATRAIDPFGLCDWRGLLTILTAAGPDELIRQVRAAENTDPAGIRWPRNKIHDDATALLIH
jgi:Protein phosphatase 2C